MRFFLTFLLIFALTGPALAQTRDVAQERITRAQKTKTLLTGDWVLDGSLTVITREDKEAITLIPENDLTYPFVRWINRAGAFMFGLTAHECKEVKGAEFCDEHFSMYRGTDGGKGKTGFFDAEFWGAAKGRRDMLTIQNTSLRADGTDLYLRSPRGRRFRVSVSDTGVLSAVPTTAGETHDDMEVRSSTR